MRFRFIVFCLLPLFAACSMSEIPEHVSNEGSISFETSLSGYSSQEVCPSSKAVGVDGLGKIYLKTYDFPFSDVQETSTKSAPVVALHASFGASAYSYPHFDNWNTSVTPNVFYGKNFTKSGAEWKTDVQYKWPGAAYAFRVYAWSPYEQAKLISSISDGGAPVIEYTCGVDISKQTDLLEGVSDADANLEGIQDYNGAGTNGGKINLSFRHALAGVRIKTDGFGFNGTIKSMTLRGIYSKGRTELYSEKWTSQSIPATYSITPNINVPQTGQSIPYSQEQTILLIPQVCASDAVIEIVFQQDGKDYTLTSSLKGYEFKKGYITTFTLGFDNNEIASGISVSPLMDFTNTNTAASQEISIKSYTIHNTGICRAEPWTVEFSENGGTSFSPTKPAWFNMSVTSGNGGIVGEKVIISVPARQSQVIERNGPDAESLARSEAMRSLPEKGSMSSPIDLSYINPDDGTALNSQNTANCYVIHQPGWYKIPLVYGNAIENGTINRESFYTSVATGFEDSWGQKFTASSDAWIKTHASAAGKTLTSAAVVWNDMDCAIENLSIQGDNLVFYMPAHGITEGNMVVGVKDNDGKYAWSWHLWITGQKLEEVFVKPDRNSSEYKIMNVNLGWNGWLEKNQYTAYPEQNCIIRFKHRNTETYKDINVRCLEHRIKNLTSKVSESVGGTSPFYQWGRKDPFMSTGNGGGIIVT